MGFLSSVAKLSPRPRRIMLYGTHGVGKSTWASCAPSPVFLPTEDGCRDIPGVESFPLFTQFGDLMQALHELATEQHGYKTLVIDSLDWLEKLAIEFVCQQENIKSIEKIGYGKGYVLVAEWWGRLLELCGQCNEKMTVIFLAHAQVERFNNPATDPYDRYSPRMDKRTSAMSQEWCDEVLFASYKTMTRAVGDEKDKKFKGIGSGDRVLYTTERPSHLAKNRLSLPDEMAVSFADYWAHVQTSGGWNNAAIDKEAAKVF